MTAFVEECRQEWKRLGVPDFLAEEMATELESDLAEAEADGVSAAEMLGESDPRRFAAKWATRARPRRRAGAEEEPEAALDLGRRRPSRLAFVFVAVLGLFAAASVSSQPTESRLRNRKRSARW